MLNLKEIEKMLKPRRFSGALELLPGESDLPFCLQGSFWAEFAENLGEARHLGFEIVKLMDEVAILQKEKKPISDDFDERWKGALEKLRDAFEKCQSKATIIYKVANNK